jgi:hypothetical protein
MTTFVQGSPLPADGKMGLMFGLCIAVSSAGELEEVLIYITVHQGQSQFT